MADRPNVDAPLNELAIQRAAIEAEHLGGERLVTADSSQHLANVALFDHVPPRLRAPAERHGAARGSWLALRRILLSLLRVRLKSSDPDKTLCQRIVMFYLKVLKEDVLFYAALLEHFG